MHPIPATRVATDLAFIGASIDELRCQRDLLLSAVRLVLPEIRHSLACGDGRFTTEQVQALEGALAVVVGGSDER